MFNKHTYLVARVLEKATANPIFLNGSFNRIGPYTDS